MSIRTQRALTAINRRHQLRRSQEQQIEDSIGRVHTVSGEFIVMGTGEALVEISFPVTFVEKPHLQFGGELSPNSVITDGAFPTVSVVVGHWNSEDRGGIAAFYRGATLCVVTTGVPEQSMSIHWSMTGRAITNPVSEGDTADSTV